MKRTNTSPTTAKPWVSLAEGQKLTHASREAILRLANTGMVGTRQLPGCRALFSRDDLLAVAESYTKPAMANQGSKPCQLVAN